GNCAGETACRLSVQEWRQQANQCTTTCRKKRLLTQHCNHPSAARPKRKNTPTLGSFLAADTAYKLPVVGKSSSFAEVRTHSACLFLLDFRWLGAKRIRNSAENRVPRNEDVVAHSLARGPVRVKSRAIVKRLLRAHPGCRQS